MRHSPNNKKPEPAGGRQCRLRFTDNRSISLVLLLLFVALGLSACRREEKKSEREEKVERAGRAAQSAASWTIEDFGGKITGARTDANRVLVDLELPGKSPVPNAPLSYYFSLPAGKEPKDFTLAIRYYAIGDQVVQKLDSQNRL